MVTSHWGRGQNPAAFTVMFAPAAEGPQDDDDDDRAEGRSSGSSRSLLNVVQRRFTAPVTVTGTGPDGASVPVPELEDGVGLVMFVSAVREGVAAPGYVDDHLISYSIGTAASCRFASLFVLVPSFFGRFSFFAE
jgi:hypothetical protein